VESKVNVLRDSTLIVDLLRKRSEATALLLQIVLAGSRIQTSTIHIAEVYAGMRNSKMAEASDFFADLFIYDVTPVSAVRAGELKNRFARIGQTRELADMIVVATALEHQLVVLTNNRKDFKDTGVTLYGATEN
jgi:predicted nucleic acid-binding protein